MVLGLRLRAAAPVVGGSEARKKISPVPLLLLLSRLVHLSCVACGNCGLELPIMFNSAASSSGAAGNGVDGMGLNYG